MRAIFLYGPPGVGKLTIGTELVALTGFKLIHNHLTVNLVTALFPFRSGPWTRLLRRVRREVFAAAAAEDTSVIITGVYAGTPEVAEAWRVMLEPIPEHGGSVLWVQLTCEQDEHFRRVQIESRGVYGKLTDIRVLAELSKHSDLFPRIPFGPHLLVDTTYRSAAESAAQIADHFALERI